MLMTVIRIAHDSSADAWAVTPVIQIIHVVTLTSYDLGHNKYGCQLVVLCIPVLSHLLSVCAIVIHTFASTGNYM